MSPQDLLAKILALSWDASTVIEQNALIKDLLSLRQAFSAIDCAAVELEFQRSLNVTRDEWFRLLASVDTERLRILHAHWQKRYLPRVPPNAGGTSNTPGSIHIMPVQAGVPSIANAQQLSSVISSGPPSPPKLTRGVSNIYPVGGWLGEYLHHFAANMESPDSFIFWSGVAAIAAVARRHVWVSFGENKIFPNFYIILTSKAGTARKAAPIKAASSFVRTIPDVNFLDRTTTERFPHDLAYRIVSIGNNTSKIPCDANGFICSEELVTFLDDQTYNTGVLKFLIDWWDCPDERAVRSHKHGVVTLKNICPTMLAGTTPDWLQNALSHIVIGGGMLSRTLFIVEDRTGKRISIPDAVDQVVKQRLTQELAYIDTVNGEFTFDGVARAWMDKWYNRFRDYLEKNEAEAASLERKQAHLLKLAMVIALSENLPLEMTPTLMERADAILVEVEKKLPEAARILQASPMGRDYIRVLDHVKKNGGEIQWSDLLRRNSPYGVDKDMLRRICQTLEQQEDLENEFRPGKNNKRNVEFWKLGPNQMKGIVP